MTDEHALRAATIRRDAALWELLTAADDAGTALAFAPVARIILDPALTEPEKAAAVRRCYSAHIEPLLDDDPERRQGSMTPIVREPVTA